MIKKLYYILLFLFVFGSIGWKSSNMGGSQKEDQKQNVECDFKEEKDLGSLVKEGVEIIKDYDIVYFFKESSDTTYARTYYPEDTVSYSYNDRYVLICISKNNKKIISKKVDKYCFSSIIPIETINEYQLWSFYFIGVEDSEVTFRFGVYIPDTDIGYSVYMTVFDNGDIIYWKKDEGEMGE